MKLSPCIYHWFKAVMLKIGATVILLLFLSSLTLTGWAQKITAPALAPPRGSLQSRLTASSKAFLGLVATSNDNTNTLTRASYTETRIPSLTLRDRVCAGLKTVTGCDDGSCTVNFTQFMNWIQNNPCRATWRLGKPTVNFEDFMAFRKCGFGNGLAQYVFYDRVPGEPGEPDVMLGELRQFFVYNDTGDDVGDVTLLV